MSHDHADSALPSVAPVWTVVVAGGSGLRFGARKQFADLAGQSVLRRSVDAAARVSSGVVVVVPSDAVSDQALASTETDVLVVAGGATRAESVRAGLAAIPDGVAYVLVHDAARPLASSALFESVVAALLGGANAVVPAISVPDSIRHVGGGIVDRRELLAVQTPQGFPLSVLRAAHASGAEATDDATLVEALGHEVVIVEGEVRNRKITEPTDLVAASAMVNDDRA
jgi:2-C-methyl-D-erythritol 4-phosphate cytidylyltransferase